MLKEYKIYIKNIINNIKFHKMSINISLNSNIDGSKLEGNNDIGESSVILNSRIGKGTYIRDHVLFDYTKIGRYCSIAPYVHLIYGDHPTSHFVAMHPSFYNGKNKCNLNLNHSAHFCEYTYVDDNKKWYCEIGNDVWIGYGAGILSGIKIGNGAVIAAGSIVTKDVPPYAIVAGVPAKIKKYRFNRFQIDILEKISWWNKDIEWIKNNIIYFDEIEDFIKKV